MADNARATKRNARAESAGTQSADGTVLDVVDLRVWYAGAVCARRSRTATVAPRNISMGPATSRTWASSKTTMAIFFMAWTGFGRKRGLIVHSTGPRSGE